jgi:hypothetical protein
MLYKKITSNTKEATRQMPEQVEVTNDYMKKAVSVDFVREGTTINANMITELLPENYKMTLNRTFETRDPVILEWYYNLARRGQFGLRVGHLIALDAYGKIPETSNIVDMSTEEKINQLVGTVTHITQMLVRTQKMTESTMTTQAKSINFLKGLSLSVKEQRMLLEAMESILTSEGTHSKDEVKDLMDSVKEVFADERKN